MVGLPAAVTAGASATFSWQGLDPSTGMTVIWGDGTANGTFTSSGTGTGSAAHTYATNGTYTQTVTNTATGQNVARRTFTVPYAGGAGFAPRMLDQPAEGDGEQPEQQRVEQEPRLGVGDPPLEEEHEEPGAGFDPAAHTVQEVQDYVLENPDQAEGVLALEEEGKSRVTLVTWLENFTTEA
jgi:hypothetical protein